MITLYHCHAARSFRPLWMLEEMGLSYELKMLPFPPRVFATGYLPLPWSEWGFLVTLKVCQLPPCGRLS